jgi:hypothetical protein
VMYQEYATTAAIVMSNPRKSPPVGEGFVDDNAIRREYNAAPTVANRISQIDTTHPRTAAIRNEQVVSVSCRRKVCQFSPSQVGLAMKLMSRRQTGAAVRN